MPAKPGEKESEELPGLSGGSVNATGVERAELLLLLVLLWWCWLLGCEIGVRLTNDRAA